MRRFAMVQASKLQENDLFHRIMWLDLIAPCGWASTLTGHIAEILEETPAMVCGASQCSKHLIITRNSLDKRTM